jgi:hypothetical protein
MTIIMFCIFIYDFPIYKRTFYYIHQDFYEEFFKIFIFAMMGYVLENIFIIHINTLNLMQPSTIVLLENYHNHHYYFSI